MVEIAHICLLNFIQNEQAALDEAVAGDHDVLVAEIIRAGAEINHQDRVSACPASHTRTLTVTCVDLLYISGWPNSTNKGLNIQPH